MRDSRMLGSVRGALGHGRLYRDPQTLMRTMLASMPSIPHVHPCQNDVAWPHARGWIKESLRWATDASCTRTSSSDGTEDFLI